MKQIHRTTGLILLLGATACGIHLFLSGNPRSVLDFWAGKSASLALLFALAVIDVFLDYICWVWIYSIFRIRIHGLKSAGIFLSGFAGLLLPMKIGNLVRPDIIERGGFGAPGESVKAEIAVVFFDGLTAVSIIAGAVAFRVNPAAALPAALFVIGFAFFFLRIAAEKIPALNRLCLPRELWDWRKFIPISIIGMISWVFSALALFVVLHGLRGNAGMDETLLIAPLSSIFVVSTGIPGGIGAMEIFLGFSLNIIGIPSSQLAIAIGAFRLLTFWIWIPIGWAAFISTNRIISKKRPGDSRPNP